MINLGLPFIILKRFIVRPRGKRTDFVQIAIAADSGIEFLRVFTVLRTFLTQLLNLRVRLIIFNNFF